MSYTAIDIGSSAIDRPDRAEAGSTRIDLANPSEGTGLLTSFEVWFDGGYGTATGVKVGTFSGSSSNYTSRDYEDLGSVTSGSKQTFTGKSCDVSSGDCLGIYYSAGRINWSLSGGSGVYYLSGDDFDGVSHSYILATDRAQSVYATGGTFPDAPTNVAASDNRSSDVRVTWTKSSGATGYRVYRDEVDVSGLLGDVSSYTDVGADAPVITAGTTVATDGTFGDKVSLSLSGVSIADGTSYTYKVKAVNEMGLSEYSTSDTGYRKASSLSYQWQKSSGDSDGSYSDIWFAELSTYNDTNAPSPVITAGSSVASDGTSPNHVALSLSGTSIANGAGRYYKCELSSSGAVTRTSSPDRGYRGAQPLEYQWKRSAGDSDASYSDIVGATTAEYNDIGAPSIGSGRYYKCDLDAEGSSPKTSTADRGYRIPSLTLNETFTLSDGFSNTKEFNREFEETFTFTEGTTLSPEYDLQSITIENFYNKMTENSSQQIRAIGNYSSVEDIQDLTNLVNWSSSNEGVSTIDSNGLILSFSAGITFIKATLGGVSSEMLMLEVIETSSALTEDSILQQIPVTSDPNQFFYVSLNIDGVNKTLGFILRWNEEAQYWSMTIYDYLSKNYYVDGLPLTTGILPTINLLQQFSYLKIGSCYLVNVSNLESNYPTKDNLGKDYLLFWGDTEE